MTSRQDLSITTVDQYTSIVSLHSSDPVSHCGGPSANISANLQDSPDIVDTQGAYLWPCIGTPVLQNSYDADFVAKLEMYLDVTIMQQDLRRSKYHSDADEWPIGRTPPELKVKREVELKAMEELWDITSNDSSDNNEDKDEGFASIRDDTRKTATAPAQPRNSRQAGGLPSPSLSAENSPATPHSRKRRRISEEDDEEKEDHARKHVNSVKEVLAPAEDTIPNLSQGRKWRRRLDVADEEAKPERNTRIITTPPSSIWKHRLRPRPRKPMIKVTRSLSTYR
jgi:hypothetical protein